MAIIQFDSHVRNPDSALVDGNYQLTLHADLVSRDGVTATEDFVFGSVEADGFFSFYGDSNADRTVNIFDLLQFRLSYLATEGEQAYDASMDFQANGIVNIFDLLQFRLRYLETLPFTFPSQSNLKLGRVVGELETSKKIESTKIEATKIESKR